MNKIFWLSRPSKYQHFSHFQCSRYGRWIGEYLLFVNKTFLSEKWMLIIVMAIDRFIVREFKTDWFESIVEWSQPAKVIRFGWSNHLLAIIFAVFFSSAIACTHNWIQKTINVCLCYSFFSCKCCTEWITIAAMKSRTTFQK